jgi:hypothetical protein
VFNNFNLLSAGYIGLVGNPRFGQHTGGSNVFPGITASPLSDLAGARA